MDQNAFGNRPYFDWSLDTWKVALIVLLFVVLLFGTLQNPSWGAGGSSRNTPAMSDAAAVQEEPVTVIEVVESKPTADEPVRNSANAGRDANALPLTLASLGPNSVVSSAGISALSGTGQPVSRVEVRDQLIVQADVDNLPVPAAEEGIIGEAEVDDRGLWTIPLQTVLEPGQHIITIREVDENGNILSVSSPAVVLVLGSGEQGPLSLATPVIRFPAPAARLRTGPTVFLGSGLPGMRVRLTLDGLPVADGVVNSREEWRLALPEGLDPGVYLAQVEALDPQGIVAAESPPVAFSVVEPVEEAAPAPSAVPAQSDGPTRPASTPASP